MSHHASEQAFDIVLSAVRAASSYPAIVELVNQPMPFDQVVRVEDVAAHSVLRVMRKLDNQSFVATARQVKCDDPKWMRHVPFNEFISEELEMRYLLARLEKMMNEDGP